MFFFEKYKVSFNCYEYKMFFKKQFFLSKRLFWKTQPIRSIISLFFFFFFSYWDTFFLKNRHSGVFFVKDLFQIVFEIEKEFIYIL